MLGRRFPIAFSFLVCLGGLPACRTVMPRGPGALTTSAGGQRPWRPSVAAPHKDAGDVFAPRAVRLRPLFDRGGADARAMRFLLKADLSRARDRKRLRALLEAASQGFNAAVALPLLRRGASLSDADAANDVMDEACKAAERVLDADLLSDAANGPVEELCHLRPPRRGRATTVASKARATLDAWRRRRYEDATRRLAAIARRLARTGELPPPRRMPYTHEKHRGAMLLGVILQLAGCEEVVSYGASPPDYLEETRARYHDLTAEAGVAPEEP